MVDHMLVIVNDKGVTYTGVTNWNVDSSGRLWIDCVDRQVIVQGWTHIEVVSAEA
jgi:hypothetical protein